MGKKAVQAKKENNNINSNWDIQKGIHNTGDINCKVKTKSCCLIYNLSS